jgi:hypothetical protein
MLEVCVLEYMHSTCLCIICVEIALSCVFCVRVGICIRIACMFGKCLMGYESFIDSIDMCLDVSI